MSTVIKKVLLLFLTLILSFAIVGCAEEELVQEEIDQIVADAVIASTDVDTSKFDMDMLMTIEVIGGVEPGEMTMLTDFTGAVDNANKEMQMTINMTMDVTGEGKQGIATEFYIVGEWMYMKTDIPVIGGQWMKTRLTEEMWEAESQIGSQIALLEAATEVDLLGSESVRGTACYVVEIVPSMEALGKLLSQQTTGLENIDWEELKLFKETSIREWIAKDSYLLMKAEIHMLMEMRPEHIGATEEDFEKMTMDINIEMKLYDYNKPVSIELPQEALGALEMPGG